MPRLNFSVDSALLSELGEKLVESVHVALLELVKNAYDADATCATVAMIPLKVGYEIHVTDNGVGMTLEQVKNYWMRIATTNKAQENISPLYGRKKAGSKGIGRFSCRRLGTMLELKTTAKLEDGRFETTALSINWEDYQPGTDVTAIACEGRTTHDSEGKSGTELVIRGGRADEWTLRGWRVLKRRLILLVSNRGRRRKGYQPDPGFNASLKAPDFEESAVVDQREQLMEAGWGRLTLRVDAAGKAEWTLNAKRLGQKKMTLPDCHPELAGVTSDIAILPDRREQFRNPQAVSITDLRATLEEWGGICIRVNGLRVPPYGEGSNDWLNIDRDRGIRKGGSEFSPVRQLAEKLRGVTGGRELLNMLSAKSYVGEINIENPTNLFEMKASREGFVGEGGIDLLRRVIRHGIDWSTVYRDYYLRLEEQHEAKQAREAFEEVIEQLAPGGEVVEHAVRYLQREVKELVSHLPASERRQVGQNTTKAIEAVLTNDRQRRDELRHLRLVASTSSLLLIFSHEVRSLLSVLDEYEMRLSSLLPSLDEKPAKQVQKLRESFQFTKNRFNDLLGMTSLLAVDSREARAERLALRSRAEKAAACFRLISRNYDIDINLARVPTSVRVGPMLEAELYSILLNVFSNAIKSVIAAGQAKRIALVAELADGQVRINVLDTGMGVTCSPQTSPFKMRVLRVNWGFQTGGRSHAEEQVFRGADHRGAEGVGGRGGDGRSVPSAGDQRADVLPVEGEVRRPGGDRREASADVGG